VKACSLQGKHMFHMWWKPHFVLQAIGHNCMDNFPWMTFVHGSGTCICAGNLLCTDPAGTWIVDIKSILISKNKS
jgi:hypothetical protein